jgi:hypothetical protein
VRLALPLGHLLSFDFHTKFDATEFAIDVSKLGIDWEFVYSSKPIGCSSDYKRALAQIRALRKQYEANGFFKPRASMPLVAAVRRERNHEPFRKPGLKRRQL